MYSGCEHGSVTSITAGTHFTPYRKRERERERGVGVGVGVGVENVEVKVKVKAKEERRQYHLLATDKLVSRCGHRRKW